MTRCRFQLLAVVAGLGFASPSWATRSIVACDAVEGACGVATISHFSTPAYVPLGEPGVAVVSMMTPYAPSSAVIVEQVLAGRSPREAIEIGLAASAWPDWGAFGVAALDPGAPGGVAVAGHLGAIALARPQWCHVAGADFVALAVSQTSAGVCQAMGDAFQATKGRLARRLLAALVAGAQVGRDVRGEYSPTLAVYSDRHADARLSKYSTWAGLVRTRAWIADLTWEAVASMAVDSPADPRDEIPVTLELTRDLQAALQKAGLYSGPANGRWSDAVEQAVRSVDAHHAFYPRNGTVMRAGERCIDGVLADFILLGVPRNAIGRY